MNQIKSGENHIRSNLIKRGRNCCIFLKNRPKLLEN